VLLGKNIKEREKKRQRKRERERERRYIAFTYKSFRKKIVSRLHTNHSTSIEVIDITASAYA